MTVCRQPEMNSSRKSHLWISVSSSAQDFRSLTITTLARTIWQEPAGAWKDIKADGIKYTFGGRTKAWVFTLGYNF